MKRSLLDFIESNTLRQQLSGQQLEPAIECILISRCSIRKLTEKLEALQERYDTYSADDFKKGVYNSRANDFKSALKNEKIIREVGAYIKTHETGVSKIENMYFGSDFAEFEKKLIKLISE